MRQDGLRFRFWCWLVAITVWGALAGGMTIRAAEDTPPADKAKAPADNEEPENPFPKRFPAPSLEGGSEWLNTAGEITLKDLRGKVVLLDFWTYCCINCMHVLPDLAYLEKKFPNELVVIGVHSAKFDNEKDSANIRQAIMRYEIEHPVINDNEMTVWRKFRANAWPTVALIDPEGQYCGYISGEGNRDLLEEVITRLVKYHRAKKTLDETPVDFHLERERVEPTPLRYPGKILADEAGGRLFISDSNHNRIVEATFAGKVTRTFGSGAIGRADGSADKASFDHPQGWRCAATRSMWPTPRIICSARSISPRTRSPRWLAQANRGIPATPAANRLRPTSAVRGTWCSLATRCSSRWPARTRFGRWILQPTRSSHSRDRGAKTFSTVRIARRPSRSLRASPPTASSCTWSTAKVRRCGRSTHIRTARSKRSSVCRTSTPAGRCSIWRCRRRWRGRQIAASAGNLLA